MKWKRVYLDYLCIYQKIMYSSLLEFLSARDMVKSDHDSYVHDGSGANLVLTKRSLTCHYASLLRLRSLVVLLRIKI